MELTPKEFQLKALDRIGSFFSDSALFNNPALAFSKNVLHQSGMLTPPYSAVRGLASTPSICLRVPTGGGKTMLGAMSIRRIANALGVEHPVVLWLTPGKDIRSQTLRALSNPEHPYRRALWNDWGNNVRVYDIADFANITRQDVAQNLSIIVATRQALQVDITEGRKVYADNENLEPHFTVAARATPDLEMTEDGSGRPKYSFANLLKVHRPIAIVDEAHQFLTDLAGKVKTRIDPRAIFELTATPSAPSNVLECVSASQLKADKLIKLPVVLAEHTGAWQTAVAEAVATRRRLADLAKNEPQYVRPLLLIQAQNEGQPGDWKAIKEYLLETERLDPNEVAVHTGDVRELDDVDLFSEKVPITTIITVQALKEGWDCSFAYVLCSVANIGSARDVEQFLGRILRMPYAQERSHPDLNRAYVHAATERFFTTADAIRGSLHGMGFEEYEAKLAIETPRGDLPLLTEPFRITLFAAPVLAAIPAAEVASVELDETPSGQVEVAVFGRVSEAVLASVLEQVPAPQQPAIIERARLHNAQWDPSPAQQGERFSVPQLTIEHPGGERLPFTEDSLEEFIDIDLAAHREELRGFNYNESTRKYLVDVDGEHLNLDLLGETQNELLPMPEGASVVSLAAWLSPRLRGMHWKPPALDAWVLNALHACQERGNSLDKLHRARFLLLRLLSFSLQTLRIDARKKAFQEILFSPETTALTTDEFSFEFPQAYPARYFCSRTSFKKHFYDRAGELKDDGEEYKCAVEIDQLEGLKYWVRNLPGPGREATSFYVPTAKHLFYPDFLGKLDDGRSLVVEYKGDHIEAEERHKKEVGELWAQRSGGRAIFVWAVARDSHGRDVQAQLANAIKVSI